MRRASSALDHSAKGTLLLREIEDAVQGIKDLEAEGKNEMPWILQDMGTGGLREVNYTQFIAASLDRLHVVRENACKAAFDLFDLDGDGKITFEDLELARGFYYTSGIENFISTMETSALMGMNVAQLIVNDYLQLLEEKAEGETTAQAILEEKPKNEHVEEL